MADESKPKEPRTAAPTGPVVGGDQLHPMELDEYHARRKARRLDPKGTWVRVAEPVGPFARDQTPIVRVHFAPTLPPGNTRDLPMTWDEYNTKGVPAGWKHAYVEMPNGAVSLLPAPPPAE